MHNRSKFVVQLFFFTFTVFRNVTDSRPTERRGSGTAFDSLPSGPAFDARPSELMFHPRLSDEDFLSSPPRRLNGNHERWWNAPNDDLPGSTSPARHHPLFEGQVTTLQKFEQEEEEEERSVQNCSQNRQPPLPPARDPNTSLSSKKIQYIASTNTRLIGKKICVQLVKGT